MKIQNSPAVVLLDYFDWSHFPIKQEVCITHHYPINLCFQNEQVFSLREEVVEGNANLASVVILVSTSLERIIKVQDSNFFIIVILISS